MDKEARLQLIKKKWAALRSGNGANEPTSPSPKNEAPDTLSAVTEDTAETANEMAPDQQDDRLKFPRGLKGATLLQYARDSSLEFGQLLEEIRECSDASKTSLADILGLN